MPKQLSINFSDEKLNLDYLGFNLPSFRPHMLEVAEIFYKYGFNSLTFNLDTEKYSTIFYIRSLLHLKLTPGTKIICLYILNRQILGEFIF